MISDANKGIAAGGIEYNHLDMPTKITVSNAGSDNGVIDYVYTANGIKIQKSKTQGGVTTTTDYIGIYVYENNNLKQISHSEGYIEPDGSNYQYVYYLKDHQNNIRITFADDNNDGSVNSSEIRREQNYYPFGLEHKGYNGASYGVKNNLKTYQDQEFTEDLGLNTHEWKYRISDPAIGRFWQIDPLAEDYLYNGVYNFSENKVVSHVELEGLEAEWAIQGVKTQITLNRPGDPESAKAVNEGYQGAATTAALFAIPGPDDLIIAGLAATKYGGAILKGISKLFGKFSSKTDDVTEIVIDANKHPESAKHLDEAIDAGKKNEGVIDRAGAANRRKENLKGTKTQKGKDRDEAPPAVMNTGESASVKHIKSSDNRGSGGSIGQQIKNLEDGTKVRIITKKD